MTVGLGVSSSRRYLLGSILSPEGRLTYLTVLTDSDFREVSIVQPDPWTGGLCIYISAFASPAAEDRSRSKRHGEIQCDSQGKPCILARCAFNFLVPYLSLAIRCNS